MDNFIPKKITLKETHARHTMNIEKDLWTEYLKHCLRFKVNPNTFINLPLKNYLNSVKDL